MNDKLTALALIRAAITEDLDALQVLMAEHPPTPGLISNLVTLAAGILVEGCGEERALAAIDGWMRVVVAQVPK